MSTEISKSEQDLEYFLENSLRDIKYAQHEIDTGRIDIAKKTLENLYACIDEDFRQKIASETSEKAGREASDLMRGLVQHINGEKAYYWTGALTKSDHRKSSYKPVGGWRVAKNEDEARGAVCAKLMEDHPEYAISEIVVSELDIESLLEGVLH